MAKILIVDDSLIMRRSMAGILQQAGHDVAAEADNGAIACELYLKCKPDLVTMDLAMPDMDGMEAMRRIVAADPGARIIVISAFDDKEKILQAIRSGASHFIIKPVTYDKVVKVIKTVMETDLSLEQRLMMAERLQAGETGPAPAFPVGPALRETPSYVLEDKHGKFIHIIVKSGMDAAQAEHLATDIEDCLFTGHRRFLFDFGSLEHLPADALAQICLSVASIQAEEGQVRAMAESSEFIRLVQNDANAKASGLANVIRLVGGR
ncbi:Protein-glutamate methylesterase/protein-glutamine glutaminase [Sporomusa carbonis]|uniref:response regulator n=1 Tax=Sporomusa carbonis TaxID=3076075 RepID=UPI003A607519